MTVPADSSAHVKSRREVIAKNRSLVKEVGTPQKTVTNEQAAQMVVDEKLA